MLAECRLRDPDLRGDGFCVGGFDRGVDLLVGHSSGTVHVHLDRPEARGLVDDRYRDDGVGAPLQVQVGCRGRDLLP